MHHRQTQSAGLEAIELLRAHELEGLAELTTALGDRLPERGIRRVVDNDDAFIIRIIEPCDGIERELQHVRRFAAGRNMDRHFESQSA